MYYLCDSVCPDLKSARLTHYVYDTSDETCCFCTLKDYKLISGMISDRDASYEKILNESKAKYFKYKTVYDSGHIPYCAWSSVDNLVVNLDIDYKFNFPRLILSLYSRFDSSKVFIKCSSRFYLTSGNMFCAAIPYEVFNMLINKKFSCFVTFFKDLKFLCYGKEFPLVLDWDTISFEI